MRIANNIVANCEGIGIVTTRKSNVDIFNNTVYKCARSYGVIGNRIDGASATFRNNISFYPANDNFYFNQNNSPVINFDFIGDYNLYYPNADQAGAFYYLNTNAGIISNTNATFDQWKASHASFGDTVDANSKTSDPLFTNASGNFSKATDFKLKSTSPAIDAGANVGLTKDYAGDTVPQGAAPDIGAYEYQAGAHQPAHPAPEKADLNQDSLVNQTDFDILKNDFLKLAGSLINPRSDIDGDGQVTMKDLGILMSGWK
jgi:hypothetical protein